MVHVTRYIYIQGYKQHVVNNLISDQNNSLYCAIVLW